MQKITRPATLAVSIVLVFALVRVLGLDVYLDQEGIKAWIRGFGVWAPVVYILIYSIAPSLMLPGLPITVAGGVIFGPFWGVVYTAVGATIGASVAFLIARRMGRAWVEHLIRGRRLEAIFGLAGKEGWKMVAFTRLIPLFPYNFLNYAFGLTGIRFTHYVIATFFFMLPGIVAYVVFSSSLIGLLEGRVSREFAIGLFLIVILSVIASLYKRKRDAGG